MKEIANIYLREISRNIGRKTMCGVTLTPDLPVFHTDCPLYSVPDQGRCQGMSRRMQALYAIQPLCSRQDKKDSLYFAIMIPA